MNVSTIGRESIICWTIKYNRERHKQSDHCNSKCLLFQRFNRFVKNRASMFGIVMLEVSVWPNTALDVLHSRSRSIRVVLDYSPKGVFVSSESI